jgi:hypothetical protein
VPDVRKGYGRGVTGISPGSQSRGRERTERTERTEKTEKTEKRGVKGYVIWSKARDLLHGMDAR